MGPGDIVGQYELVKRLGQGAFGDVWLGRHAEGGWAAAVKLPRSTEHIKSLAREGRLAGKLKALAHPNIVDILDLNTSDDPVYIIYEYVEGLDLASRLREYIKENTSPPVGEILEIGAEVFDGLAAAHGDGIVHRDIKPSNILLSKDDEVKIADFGLGYMHQHDALPGGGAALSFSQVSGAGLGADAIAGTLAYMSPEQRRGDVATAASDVYSTGVVLYEALTGELPEGAFEPPSELRPEVPEKLDEFVLKCLGRRPATRPAATDAAQTMRSMASSIQTPQRAPGTHGPAACTGRALDYVQKLVQWHPDKEERRDGQVRSASTASASGEVDPDLPATERQVRLEGDSQSARGLCVKVKRSPVSSLFRNSALQMFGAGLVAGYLAYIAEEFAFEITSIDSPEEPIKPIFLMLLHGIWVAVASMVLSSHEGLVSLSFGRMARDAAVGLVVGFLTGSLVPLIHIPLFVLAGFPASSFEQCSDDVDLHVVWGMLFGLAVGLAQGVRHVAWHRVANGLIGGVGGGTLGYLLVYVIRQAGGWETATASLMSSIGVVGTMGAAIGLIENVRKQTWLTVVEGPMLGREFIVYKQVTTMGWAAFCDIPLFKGPNVAPQHARIERDGNSFTLVSIAGPNATAVNGVPIQRCTLHSGDLIRIGQTKFCYQDRTKGRQTE